MLTLLLRKHLRIAFAFLILGAFFGLVFALQLVGIGTSWIRPDIARSLHLSLMLYGFIPLALSTLPFLLFEKEGVLHPRTLQELERFFWLWYIFLLFMIMTLLSGVHRGLPFYDFTYELNFILAFAGLFYLSALWHSVRLYKVKPLWVKTALAVTAVSPLMLLVLMNPRYGQVEKTLSGPHGDNTLGMSFALLVVYYLAIRLASPSRQFHTRWHLLWIIPLTGYVASVLYRSFVGTLSYEAEWFFQYLTLLYIPLLYRWWKDANLSVRANTALLLSILAFVFVDVEGNILFIPQIRELFHRNDLVVGHAHIAVGIGVLFLAFAVVKKYLHVSRLQLYYLGGMLVLMASVLSISGMEQAGLTQTHTQRWWELRALYGLMFFGGLFFVYTLPLPRRFAPLALYHAAGALSDGIGGLLLLFFGHYLYGFLGAAYEPGYQQIVFGFVAAVGMMHAVGLFYEEYAPILATATAIVRAVTAAGFFALFKAGVIGWIALPIALTDMTYVMIYLLYLRKDRYENRMA